MRCQILFYREKSIKYYKMLSAENFTHSATCRVKAFGITL